jgi:hypothetical protein
MASVAISLDCTFLRCYSACIIMQSWKCALIAVSVCNCAAAEQGVLNGLQWYDLSCNACGGRTSQICIHQVCV